MNDTAVAKPGGFAIALRRSVIGAVLLLIGLVASWCVAGGATPGTIGLAGIATAPLWLGLRRIIAGQRRTYAWMTLALAPYLVLSITESIANPARRAWAGACLFATLVLFALLVAYLRATRDVNRSPSLP